MCNREISESEAVSVYKEVLDNETGELKRVIDYFLYKSRNVKIMKMTGVVMVDAKINEACKTILIR